MPCWKGYQRVPGTRAYTKGSCRKIKKSKSPRRRSSKKKSRSRRRSPVRKTRRKKSRAKKSPVRRSRKKKSRSRRRYSYRIKSRTRRKSPRRKSKSKRKSKSRRKSPKRKSKSKRKSTRRRSRACVPGPKKKFAKVVNGKCVRFGDPNMTIKKNQPGRRKSFRARHGCDTRPPSKMTARYWSCKKW